MSLLLLSSCVLALFPPATLFHVRIPTDVLETSHANKGNKIRPLRFALSTLKYCCAFSIHSGTASVWSYWLQVLLKPVGLPSIQQFIGAGLRAVGMQDHAQTLTESNRKGGCLIMHRTQKPLSRQVPTGGLCITRNWRLYRTQQKLIYLDTMATFLKPPRRFGALFGQCVSKSQRQLWKILASRQIFSFVLVQWTGFLSVHFQTLIHY